MSNKIIFYKQKNRPACGTVLTLFYNYSAFGASAGGCSAGFGSSAFVSCGCACASAGFSTGAAAGATAGVAVADTAGFFDFLAIFFASIIFSVTSKL